MKYQIKNTINHKFYFVLKARNGEIICTSEVYETKQACKKGISAIKRSWFAPTVDLTHQI